MSRCFDRITLQAHVDRELSAEQQEAVVAHLDHCARCAALVSGLRSVCEPLRVTGPVAVPDDLGARVLEAVSGLAPVAPLTCKQATRLASVAADGALSFAEAEQLEAHLTSCVACRRAAAETSVVTAALRGVAPEDAPAGLLSRTLTAVAQSTPAAVRHARPVWRRVALTAAGLAAAAALLLAVLTTGVPRRGEAPAVVVRPPVIEYTAPSNRSAAPAPKMAPSPLVRPTTPRIVPSAAKIVSASGPRAPRSARPPVERVRLAVVPASVATSPRKDLPSPHHLMAPESPAAADLPPMTAPVTLAMRRVDLEHPCPGQGAVAPRVDSPSGTPTAAEGNTPVVSHAATLLAAKSAPSPDAVRATEGTAERRTRNWVSRPAAEERDVYRADDNGPRLAMAREKLGQDVREFMAAQPREWVIR